MNAFILSAALLLSFQDDAAKARSLLEKLESDDPLQRDAATADLKKLAPLSEEVDRLIERAAQSGGAETRQRALAVVEDRRLVRLAAKVVSDPEDFVARLRSPDPKVRDRAFGRVQSLGASGAPFAAYFLTPGDPHAYQALSLVGFSGDPRYVDKVRGLLGDPNVRNQALDTLSRLGDSAIRPELKALVGDPRESASFGIRALGRLRHADDIEYFGQLIRNDSSSVTRDALTALHGWREAQKKLADEIVRLARLGSGTAVLLALEGRDPRLADAIKDSHTSPEALFARAVLGDRTAVPHLLRIAKYGPKPRLGLWGLGILKAPEAPSLVRRGRPSPHEGAADLRRALDSLLEETEILNSQGGTLSFRKKSTTFDAYGRAVETRDRPGEMSMALWMLGEVGGLEAEVLALESLKDPDERIRASGCASLGRMKSRQAEPELVKLLDDALAFNPHEAAPAPPALGEDSSRVFQKVLRAEAGKGWVQVREAAVAALEDITGERFGGSLDEKVRAWKQRGK